MSDEGPAAGDPDDPNAAARRRAAAATVLDEVVGAGASGGDVVVRDGASLLVRRGDVVVRVRLDTPGDVAVAEREVELAARLRRDGVPVVGLVDGPGVVHLDGFVASCWEWIPAVRPTAPADLGLLARHLREDTAPTGPDGLPTFDPLGHVLAVVGECGDDDGGACFVRERADALRTPYAEAAASDPRGAAVVHGDLHADNAVVGPDGPLLLDLELGGWGPASYDLTPAFVGRRRYGAPAADLGEFVVAAGIGDGPDPQAWPGFEVLVDVYELWVTAWAVSVGHRRDDWAAEAAVRVASLRDGDDRTWRLS